MQDPSKRPMIGRLCQELADMRNEPWLSLEKIAGHLGVSRDTRSTADRYLKDVLTRLPSMTNHQVPSITPAAWAAARKETRRAS